MRMMDISTESGLLKAISEFIYKVDEKYSIQYAYLFGSTARGKDRTDSDVDIAVKFKQSFSNEEDMFIRGEIIDMGRTFLQREVDLVSLEKAPTILKYEIVRDGIVIKEGDGRASFESLALREYFDFEYYSKIYNDKVIENIKEGKFF